MSPDSQVVLKIQELKPGEVPMPLEAKHPLRVAVRGVTDTIENLKKIVADFEIHPGLKAYLLDELAALQTNGAEIHLHDVESAEAGFDLHLSVKGRHMGVKDGLVFKRTEPVAPAREIEPVAAGG